ncbi:MAG: hypothetical protein CMO40_00220 [Verrucomicrobiaceae bacterium]|nr:hypothetical protein [Verrucomicrobiaceae bacterium]
MRGNPILRAALLVVAMCLTSILVATVLRNTGPLEKNRSRSTGPPPRSDTVPALLTLTLSAPAESIMLKEQSGRIISIPTGDELEIEEDVEISVSNQQWTASLSVVWKNVPGHRFLRLDLEPEKLKSDRLLLDFPGDVTNHPVRANFDPSP